MVGLLYMLACAALFASAEDTCPEGWSQFESSCYVIPEEEVRWEEAQDMCRDLGGNLAEVNSASEEAFLVKFLVERAKKGSCKGVYLGGNDMMTGGDWRWVDSGEEVLAFTVWDESSNQPDNRGPHRNEDCLQLRLVDDSWNDYSCFENCPFVCERRPFVPS